MRTPHVLLLAIIAFVAVTSRCTSQKEPAYDPPPNTAGDSAAAFAEHWRKGKVLYALNCAGCHDTLVNGRKVVPDFSLPQLLDYEMRYQYPAHDDRLREVDVSIAELDDIQVYLQYKKRSGVPVAPLPKPQPPPKVN